MQTPTVRFSQGMPQDEKRAAAGAAAPMLEKYYG